LLAELLEWFVDRESGAHRGDLEQHPGGLAEVDRAEVVAVDDRRRPRPRLRHTLLPGRLLLGRSGPGHVVYRARSLQTALGGRRVVDVAAAALFAADLP